MVSKIYARADQPSGVDEPQDAEVLPSLAEALDKAQPGTVIQLLPGRFTRKVRIRHLSGQDGAPIIIQGSSRATVIDGQMDPVNDPADREGAWPAIAKSRRDVANFHGRKEPFFHVRDAAWIEWRDLWVENCWPFFLNLAGCHHLTVAGCRILGGAYTIYINDENSKRPSHHLLIEDNHWSQDTTGDSDPSSSNPAGKLSWQDWTWHEMKKKPKNKKGWEDLRFMNGGFVGGAGLAGTIIIRRNEMRFAFNAIRIENDGKDPNFVPLRPEDQGNAPFLDPEKYGFNYDPPDATRNTNVEIYENLFEYIRDNAIEPEFGATNWWVWNNRLKNVHKAISIHNNGVGFWYFFGNVGGTEAIPPAQLNEPEDWRDEGDPIRKLGGKIFKFFFGPPLPTRRCLAMHNSWRPRGGVVTGGGEMRFFIHMNNAVQHCAPADPSTIILCDADPSFAEMFDPEEQPGKPFDYGFATRVPPLTPSAENTFDNDVSNGSDFPDRPQQQDQERQGLKAVSDVFDPARREQYVLAENSVARGAARPVTLKGGVDWPAEEDWSSDAPDAGAVQLDGHFRGPAFAHHANPHYDEAPRLVAVEPNPVGLALVFSVPLDPIEPDPQVSSNAAIAAADGALQYADDLSVQGRRLILRFREPVAVSDIGSIVLPDGITGGLSGKSLSLTSWAAILPLSIGTADRR